MHTKHTLWAAALLALTTLPPARAQDAGTLGAPATLSPIRLDQLPLNDALWVESLDLGKMTQGYGTPQVGRSVDKNPLTLGGNAYVHGIGTHAQSEFIIDLKGAATKFISMVGVDDEKKGSKGSVTFQVYVDGKKAADSGVMRAGDAPKVFLVPLNGARRMTLRVDDAGDGIDSDHADWAGAQIILNPGTTVRPIAMTVPVEPPRLVMPAPDPRTALHGPRIYGSTPGHPFLFLIPATGQGPLTFGAKNLPAGLALDSRTGIIAGSLRRNGRTRVEVSARGPRGTARRTLTIVGGPRTLSLTPPMGWNSWNSWAGNVDDGKVRASADAMIRSGLAGHGFQFINIDDCWQAGRDAGGGIESNARFPSMKALADYVHGLGLKAGLYSSPGPKTCAGFTASYQHELQDAQTYAAWGYDYLKYDWCSYGGVATGEGLTRQQKPYVTMGQALGSVNRDIVYSLCQYGMADVWKWGADPAVSGNCWRTTDDINDSWGSLHGIYSSQNGHEKFAGPGHWNDPDMLVVGQVGWGNPHPSRLTPNEQILHISMWCLLSSPLLIGCDMSKLDPFTLALLTNDEALDVNQDPLGRPAGRVSTDGSGEVWARPLFDGTIAVGLLNNSSEPTVVTAKWSDMGLRGRQPVRDLWLHKDIGTVDTAYSVSVPAHGAVMLKIGKPRKGSD